MGKAIETAETRQFLKSGRKKWKAHFLMQRFLNARHRLFTSFRALSISSLPQEDRRRRRSQQPKRARLHSLVPAMGCGVSLQSQPSAPEPTVAELGDSPTLRLSSSSPSVSYCRSIAV
eukprot:2664541-Prymnesium_polylepis.1